MVVVDSGGIERTGKRLGGEGTNILLLKASRDYDAALLDDAIPVDDGEGPANGGWFPGPRGWLLLVEGLDEVVKPWIDRLTHTLTERGVEGTLTGAGTASPPAWARNAHLMRTINGLVGFAPDRGTRLADPWVAGDDSLEQALTAGGQWLSAHDAKVMAVIDLRARTWADSRSAQALMAADVRRTGVATADSFAQTRQEIRSSVIDHRATLELGSSTDVVPWREVVDELKSAMMHLRLANVSVAMASHRRWLSLLFGGYGRQASDPFHGSAYAQHPELWDSLVLEPCGIQILTRKHLSVAHDLSSWHTTKLDADHYLVEAKDLEPWYGNPPRHDQQLDQALLQRAYADFGPMVLTPKRAEALGISGKRDRQQYLA